MPLLTNQAIITSDERTYNVHVPAAPPGPTSPPSWSSTAAARIRRRSPPAGASIRLIPVPAELENYLLVFPEADRRLTDEWVHFKKGDSAFPTFDLEFVDALLAEITNRPYSTGSVAVPDVSADPT